MKRAGLIVLSVFWAGMSGATGKEALGLPSGLEATPLEMLLTPSDNGPVYRFRFMAPEFTTEGMDLDAMMIDLEHLCNTYARPYLHQKLLGPGQVIISLANGNSVFGEIDPDVAQVFEAYRIENDACVWEVF